MFGHMNTPLTDYLKACARLRGCFFPAVSIAQEAPVAEGRLDQASFMYGFLSRLRLASNRMFALRAFIGLEMDTTLALA